MPVDNSDRHYFTPFVNSICGIVLDQSFRYAKFDCNLVIREGLLSRTKFFNLLAKYIITWFCHMFVILTITSRKSTKPKTPLSQGFGGAE